VKKIAFFQSLIRLQEILQSLHIGLSKVKLSPGEEEKHLIFLFPVIHWQYWAHRYLLVLNIYQNYNVW